MAASSSPSGLAIFALGWSRAYGERVAGHLGLRPGAHEEREFEDGEHKIRPLESVRGKDVYVVASLYGEPGASANDKLVRLLNFLGALGDAGAERRTAVVPYLAYARKDRKTKPRDPVTTRYIAALFEAVGTDVVLTLDVHNLAAYQNAFRIRCEHLEARPLFVRALLESIGGGGEDGAGGAPHPPVVVVSPDAGGVKRADAFRESLEQRLRRPVGSAFMEKRRSAGIVSGEALVGEVEGAFAVVVDDMIAGGTTMARTAEACRARGAERVVGLATHGLFAGDAEARLSTPALDRLLVTDSVPPFRLSERFRRERVAMVETAGLVGEAIGRLHRGGSLVELLEA